MAAAKTHTPKTASKSDFIRSQPASLSVVQVVAKAKSEGVTISPGLVYEVRRRGKSKGRAKGKAKRFTVKKTLATPNGSSKASVGRHSPSATTNEEELLKIIAAEVGLGRAIELLQGERARVHAILRGSA